MIGNQVAEDLRRCCDALEADNKRLREALEGLLNALPSATTHPAIKAARSAVAHSQGKGRDSE